MQENQTSYKCRSVAVFRVLAVMLLVTLISGHVISGTVAKYATAGGPASDNARVARFSVTALGDDENGDALSLEYGTENKSKSYSISVTNDSEVTVKYTVIIGFDQDVNGLLTATLSKASGGAAVDGVYDAAENTFKWRLFDTLDIGDSAELTLTLTAGDGIKPGETDKTEKVTFSSGFNTQVLFTQLD